MARKEYNPFGTRVVKATPGEIRSLSRPTWDVHDPATLIGPKTRQRVSAFTATGAVIKVFFGREN